MKIALLEMSFSMTQWFCGSFGGNGRVDSCVWAHFHCHPEYKISGIVFSPSVMIYILLDGVKFQWEHPFRICSNCVCSTGCFFAWHFRAQFKVSVPEAIKTVETLFKCDFLNGSKETWSLFLSYLSIAPSQLTKKEERKTKRININCSSLFIQPFPQH